MEVNLISFLDVCLFQYEMIISCSLFVSVKFEYLLLFELEFVWAEIIPELRVNALSSLVSIYLKFKAHFFIRDIIGLE